MDEAIESLRSRALAELAGCGDAEALSRFRVAYLGRNGAVRALLGRLSSLPPEERPAFGRDANLLKREIEEAFRAREAELARGREGGEAVDITIPGRRPRRGHFHPVSLVMAEVCATFSAMGFEIAEGPDVETDFYNFEALNIPPHHPARDMHDTFYVSSSILLRTHTSPMQVRAMEARRPPLRMIAPGKVYRCDSDVTHTPMFHQVEGFLVDEAVSFADLKGVLSLFIARTFSPDTPIRFRPSFFPFTEPSAEVDIGCVICGGSGCRVCKQTGWLEILGAGMIDPEVFRSVGYDPEAVSGFAFGLGVERIAMLKYGIDDLRLFYENDRRFIEQF